MTKDQTFKKYKALHVNSAMMYKFYCELQRFLRKGLQKGICINDQKRWESTGKDIVRRVLRNPWNKLDMMLVCSVLGRSPYSVFNCYMNILWQEYDSNTELFNRAKDIPII